MSLYRFEGAPIISRAEDWKEVQKILDGKGRGRMTARDRVQRAEQELRGRGRQALEDTALAANAKEKALSSVRGGASDNVLAALSRCLGTCIASGVAFTTDDIWFQMAQLEEVKVREPRVIGSLIKEASEDNRIVPTGEWRLSRRAACHQRPMRVWRRK